MKKSTQLGSLIGTFVTSGDVADAKARLVPSFNSTNSDVASSALPTATKNSWTAFYQSWLAFDAEDEHTFGNFWTAGSRMDRVETFGQSLLDWQGKVQSAGVVLSTPTVIPSPSGLPQNKGTGDEIISSIKALAWLAGIVVGGIALIETIPIIRSVWPSRKKNPRRRR